MLKEIKNELLRHGIDCVSAIPLSLCKVTKPYKLERAGFDTSLPLYAVIMAVPYFTEHSQKNISSYCIPRDYHLFFKELFNAIIPRLNELFPNNKFAGFTDDSPIDERDAAAMSGLGIIGDNGMLIMEKYSSYVFIGEIITDLPINVKRKYTVARCEGCGRCKKACPIGEIGECLSALTQKKGELTVAQKEHLKKHGCAWGCDICQEVCPHTEKALKNKTIYTNIEFFKKDLTPIITSEIIDQMSDEEFATRAYSWRKRETVKRNLEILENSNNIQKR